MNANVVYATATIRLWKDGYRAGSSTKTETKFETRSNVIPIEMTVIDEESLCEILLHINLQFMQHFSTTRDREVPEE